MRKIFTLLTMCLLASAAWATVITFDATVDTGTGSSTAAPYKLEKTVEGITVTVDVTKGMANGQHYRVYKNETMTISTDVGEISNIVLTCTAEGEAQYGPGCFTTDVPTYTYSGKIGTWDGGSSKVVFTAVTNQVRITKIEVTVGGGGLAAPTFTPGAGTYYEPIQVALSCRTPEAKIYYTTNGSTPTTSSTEYSAPLSLSSNTTIKAISVLNGETSQVAEAAYTFVTPENVANIAAYSGKADETVVKFTNSVNAIAQKGSYLYVKDNTGYGLFYGKTDQTYALGDVIPAGFVGKKITYGGEPELSDLYGFMAASGNVEITPEEITTAMVNHDHWAHYVHFTTATIDPEGKTLTDAVGTAPVYFSLDVTAAQVTAGTEYEVWAIVGSYKPADGDVVYQLLPIKIKRKGKVGIGNMGDFADGTILEFDYDATVLFHGNSRLFVKDETGFGLIYGSPGQTYKKGDVFPKGYGGKKTTYSGEPELTKDFTGFQAASGHVTVTPEPATPLEVKHEYFAHYVVMSNVTISELSGNNFKITDANGNTCNGYNQFSQDIHEGFYEKLEGIVGSFGTASIVYQLLPIVETPPTDVRSISELYDLNTGKQGHFTTPLTAIYQKGVRMYVQDVDGTQTLVYGGVPGEFVNGDIINDAIASWSLYQNAKQMVPQDNFVPAGHGTEILPDDPMPIEEISQEMIHRYVSFEDVDIIEEDGTQYIVDETGRIKLFNQFEIEYTGVAPYYIQGFVAIHSGELEIFPILVEGIPVIDPCGIKGDVNNDQEIGVADINALIDIILGGSADECTRWRADVAEDGEIGVADVNALIDLILSGN
jgi:hypothetical protein